MAIRVCSRAARRHATLRSAHRSPPDRGVRGRGSAPPRWPRRAAGCPSGNADRKPGSGAPPLDTPAPPQYARATCQFRPGPSSKNLGAHADEAGHITGETGSYRRAPARHAAAGSCGEAEIRRAHSGLPKPAAARRHAAAPKAHFIEDLIRRGSRRASSVTALHCAGHRDCRGRSPIARAKLASAS